MGLREGEDLGRFAREHHVHYELEPEAVVKGEEREAIGFEVRLFATHGESRLEAPGCPRCVALQEELRSFAQRVVASGDAAERAEIEPAVPALYGSAEVPGADEVSVAVRIRCGSPDHRAGGAGEDRCLGELRQRLDALGVPRR